MLLYPRLDNSSICGVRRQRAVYRGCMSSLLYIGEDESCNSELEIVRRYIVTISVLNPINNLYARVQVLGVSHQPCIKALEEQGSEEG
jgi:hypothetical protein